MKSKDRNGEKLSITVGEFLEESQKPLNLELVAGGEGMDNRIIEAAINRPGLALTGFYEYFAWKRIQTFGYAENKYVDSLSSSEHDKRLREFFGSKIPCVVTGSQ